MLSRFTAALSPTTSSGDRDRLFKRFKPPSARSRERDPGEDPPAEPPAAADEAREGAPSPAASVHPIRPGIARNLSPLPFLQLLGTLEATRLRFMKWFGLRAYQDAARRRRSAKIFRKGAMLDRSA